MTNQKIIKYILKAIILQEIMLLFFTITEGLTKIKKTNKIDVL